MFNVLAMRRIKDVMTMGVVTVKFYEPLKDVLERLEGNGISAIVVVDDQGEAMGIVSHFDIIQYLKDRSQADFSRMNAEDVMTPFTISIRPEKTLKDAAELMVDNKIHRLPVLHSVAYKKYIPVGIISASDIVRILTEELD